MSLQDYELKELIGRGSFGSVFRAIRQSDGLQVVIKQMIGRGTKEARAEARVLAELSHPSIVRYIGTIDNASEDMLVMEYCDGGDLAALIQSTVVSAGVGCSTTRRRPGLPESTVLDYLAQMALGIHYLHSQNLMHRDLKSPNVFLLDGQRRLKLGDFGVSTFLETPMDFAETCICTPFYMSPELFNNVPYSFKSDIWALGCITYEMLTGAHAFNADSLPNLSKLVVKGKYTIPQVGSPNLLQLVKRMLCVEAAKRPTAALILQSPLLNRPLRYVVDRFLSGSTGRNNPIEICNLCKQTMMLGLNDMIELDRIGMSPGRGASYFSSYTPSSTPTLNAGQAVLVEEGDDGEGRMDKHDARQAEGQRQDWSWTSQSDEDPKQADPERKILHGDLNERRVQLMRRCRDAIGDHRFQYYLEKIEQEPVLSRPGSHSSHNANQDLVGEMEHDLGGRWLFIADAIEQLLWIKLSIRESQ